MRDQYRQLITKLFEDLGNFYKSRGAADVEIVQGWDVHAFYRLTADSSRVVHLQGYPGFSSNEEAKISARTLDYDMMMELRSQGTSVGNEHDAVLSYFYYFAEKVPYDLNFLEEKLAACVPKLRIR